MPEWLLAQVARKGYLDDDMSQGKLYEMLTEVIRKAGGVNALARGLGVSPQAVSQWRQIPVRHVLSIERITGVAREDQRPDVYPPDDP